MALRPRWWWLSLLISQAVLADDASTISVALGTQRAIAVTDLSRIGIGNPAVIDARAIGGNQVLITGSGEGKTSLIFWKNSGARVTYTVVVRKQDPNEIISELKKLLGELEGVTTRVVGDRIYLDGQAYTQADADRI